MARTRAALLMPRPTAAEVFDEPTLARLRRAVDLAPAPFESTADLVREVPDVAVLLTGWGSPVIELDDLALLPELTTIVHTAGSVKPVVADEVMAAGVQVSSQAEVNARPVAEMTFAFVVLALKRFSRFAWQLRTTHARRDEHAMPRLGTAGARIGLLGMSRVARALLPLLSHLDAEVVVSDPYLDAEHAAQLGVRKVELSELFAGSDVVAILAPLTEQTRGMVTAELLASMPDFASLINVARGPILDHRALEAELVSGRLDAYLDVSDPEPLPADSPLYELPNVVLTPHIAGSLGTEIYRLGEAAVAEVEAVVAGLPLNRPVDGALLARIG